MNDTEYLLSTISPGTPYYIDNPAHNIKETCAFCWQSFELDDLCRVEGEYCCTECSNRLKEIEHEYKLLEMINKIVYEVGKDEMSQALKDTLNEVMFEVVLGRYSGRLVGAGTAAEILTVSLPTLYRYIKDGKIKTTERNQKKYRFDLRYLLEWNLENKYKRA